jgi:hypothetical protein
MCPHMVFAIGVMVALFCKIDRQQGMSMHKSHAVTISLFDKSTVCFNHDGKVHVNTNWY